MPLCGIAEIIKNNEIQATVPLMRVLYASSRFVLLFLSSFAIAVDTKYKVSLAVDSAAAVILHYCARDVQM